MNRSGEPFLGVGDGDDALTDAAGPYDGSGALSKREVHQWSGREVVAQRVTGVPNPGGRAWPRP